MKKAIRYISGAVAYGLPAMALATLGDTSNLGLNAFAANTNLGTNVELITTVARLINIVLGFLGVLVVVGIVIGGFKRMTAAGDEGKIGEGNKLIGAGVVGLVIILAAYAIASFVITQLVQATGYNN